MTASSCSFDVDGLMAGMGSKARNANIAVAVVAVVVGDASGCLVTNSGPAERTMDTPSSVFECTVRARVE